MSVQVCWYWKYLADSNELWAPKCIKRGWTLSGTINGFELGIWKKHYIQNMRYLQLAWPMKVAAMDIMAKLEEAEANAKRELELHRQKTQAELRAQQLKLKLTQDERGNRARQKSVPWRGPDKRPTETKRLNYFDNPFTVQSNSGQSQPRRNTSCGRFQTNPKEDNHPRRIPDRMEREIPVSVGDSRPHSTDTDFIRVNPMVAGPQIPWRPTSKHPKIQSSTNLEETGRLSGSARQPKKRPSSSARLERHSPEEITECYEQDKLGLIENADDIQRPVFPNGITTEEPQLEHALPPPPPYTKSHLQRPLKGETTLATEELSGFSVPIQQTPVRIGDISSVDSSFTGPLYAPEPKLRHEATSGRNDDHEDNGDHKVYEGERIPSKKPPDRHLLNADYEAVGSDGFDSVRDTL
ncbi:F-box protein 16 [Paragonimus westermani]|uniref:F-box protein 16 n=1 Tax=Paragonimus westermani TaxID=34504 RepID=A0A8T0DBE8_9TREM|nr:F-box protein 16 [Paragonimus westermani]